VFLAGGGAAIAGQAAWLKHEPVAARRVMTASHTNSYGSDEQMFGAE
jgi:hypothetical protein